VPSLTVTVYPGEVLQLDLPGGDVAVIAPDLEHRTRIAIVAPLSVRVTHPELEACAAADRLVERRAKIQRRLAAKAERTPAPA
jgi:hypothetical protein